MRYVYGIAFREDEFLMVYNPRREGWEMPGGKVEEGESDDQAMLREFREEVGREFVPVARMEIDGCSVYTGRVGDEVGKGEMEWRCFDELPSKLSFPRVEYVQLIDWARVQLGVSEGDRAGPLSP